MFTKFSKLLAIKYTQVQVAKCVEHKINLKEEAKMKVQELRSLGVIKEMALLKEVTKLLQVDFICPIKEVDWFSLVFIVLKKNGKIRVCMDFKHLNVATRRHHYPLPFHDKILN